jgi:predicted nucleotidyltransferase component of viral defense system
MLQTQTVEPGNFSLLKDLMALPELHDFCLVGGTALSLLYGHRISVDLDLFSTTPFENADVVKALQKKFKGSFVNRSTNPRFGIFGFINQTKVDLINYPHPLIRPPKIIEGIRMFSVEDIMAMKVQAILGRGKKKDFWDIAELLQHFSVEDFIRFHKEKYSTQHLFITVPQALIYFADAEESEAPMSLKGQTWESVQAFIQEKVRAYLQ